MLLIRNERTEPYFNLALEEYLFRNFTEDCFMLWRNEDAIVVGKHQNAMAEINAAYAEKNNIKIIRRLSGGGTVFHDPGNINFTFILTRESERVVDFKRYMKPIYEVLRSLHLNVVYSDRNDLFIDGKKISGNAEHAVKNRVLHHGTLLFSAGIDKLKNALMVRPGVYTDNAVKSVRSPVTNIQPLLESPLEIEDFMALIRQYVSSTTPGTMEYELSEADVAAVRQLVTGKYATWEWNYGYSPKYTFHHSAELEGFPVGISISVNKGSIAQVSLQTEHLSDSERLVIAGALTGLQHREGPMREKLMQLASDGHISQQAAKLITQVLI